MDGNHMVNVLNVINNKNIVPCRARTGDLLRVKQT